MIVFRADKNFNIILGFISPPANSSALDLLYILAKLFCDNALKIGGMLEYYSVQV